MDGSWPFSGTRSRRRARFHRSKSRGTYAANVPSNQIPKAAPIRRRGRIVMARTKDAATILERLTGEGPTVRQDVANARVNLEVAQMIYNVRTKAGLTQRGLAELIGSKQSVIARLEDADYEGHSLSM